jgi:hypothetical protein
MQELPCSKAKWCKTALSWRQFSFAEFRFGWQPFKRPLPSNAKATGHKHNETCRYARRFGWMQEQLQKPPRPRSEASG